MNRREACKVIVLALLTSFIDIVNCAHLVAWINIFVLVTISSIVVVIYRVDNRSILIGNVICSFINYVIGMIEEICASII